MDISRSETRSKAQVPPPSHLTTFVELCRWQAERQPDQPAFSHLSDDGKSERHLSYSQWDQRIRAIAAVLGENGKPGDRVLIVHQPGIEYVASLFACMYAGMVAVPVYPPDLFRLRQTLPRLQAITADADARIMLSSRDVLGDSLGPMWSLVGDRAIATEEIDDHVANDFRGPSVRAGDLALLQFTSGSTGTPRGVALTHANIMANAQQGFYAFDVPDAVCVFWLPPYHDLGLIGGMLIPVYGGRRSVLMSPIAFLQQPIRWFEAIHRFQGTTTASPNFGYEWCLRKINLDECEGLDLSSWKLAAVGAEPVRANTLRRFAERFAPIGFSYSAFTPGYGMAEATLAITSKPIESEPIIRDFDATALHAELPVAKPIDSLAKSNTVRTTSLVSSGQPVRECEVRIVDPVTRQLLPDGHIGEIWVASPSVAKEYWNRPELSRETFQVTLDQLIPGTVEEESFLRTGDLGFLLDNELFVSGRLKEQIIIAGRNYFPHDIETAIQSSHEAFKADGGIAFSVDHPDGERLVIVQEILRPKRFDFAQLTDHLRQAVYEETNLIPHAICLVAAASLPKTSSGKLRRLECRKQYLEGELQLLSRWESANQDSDAITATVSAGTNEAADDPSTWNNTLRRLAPIWCAALEIKRAARSQHFLEVGGHSLGAHQLLSRIRDEFKVGLTLSDLARAPRFGELASEIEQRLDRPDPLAQTDPISQHPAREMTLTQSQSRFWVLDQLQRSDAFLYVGVDYAIEGPLDVERLKNCIASLPARHEALRVSFELQPDGSPRQKIHEPFELTVDFRDVSNEPSSRIKMMLEQLVHTDLSLESCPLLKVCVLKEADQRHHIQIAAHHIVADGWSMGLLIQDIANAYAADVTLKTSNKSSAWSQAVSRILHDQQKPISAAGLNYWRRRYAGISAKQELEVPTSTGNVGVPNSQVISKRLSHQLSSNIVQAAKQLGVTPFSLLVSSWYEVLCRYRASSDILLGIPVANRVTQDEEQLVGCFIDVLPFRVDHASEVPTDQRIRSTNQMLMDDVSNLNSATEEILRDSMIDAADLPMPLVQHLVLQQPILRQELRLGNAAITGYSSDYSCLAAYQTSLIMETHDQALELSLAFCPSKLSSRFAENLLESLASVVAQVTEFAAEGSLRSRVLQLPASQELARLRNRLWNLEQPATDAAIMQLFASQVSANPDLKAIEDQAGAMTYAQLDQESARIAAWLAKNKYGKGSRVGVLLNRSVHLPAVLLGIWKCGAAYLPLDGRQPEARLRNIIKEAAPSGIVVDADSAAALDHISTACPTIDLRNLLRPDEHQESQCSEYLAQRVVLDSAEPAYLIFTSGSTGRPKGVVIDHQNVTNFLQAMSRRPGLRKGERLLASTTVTFDISVLELFLPLAVGATCVLTPTSLSDDADAVMQFIASRRVDVMQSTPSSLRLLLALGWQPPSRMRIWAGGERMPIDLADRLLEDGIELWNMYGPTETTVWSSVGRITSSHHGCMSIGEPIQSTYLRIVDQLGRDVPEGIAGELWIGGAGVARGYWHHPQLTAERFVSVKTSPTSRGARYYKTGDVARINDAGQLEILGRSDRQIKLLGHRIELDEIEKAMLEHGRVREAAVTFVQLTTEDPQIVGFYTTVNDQPLAVDVLRSFLHKQLPSVMVPTSLIPLASLPLTAAGKIDYRVLPTDQCVLRSGRASSDQGVPSTKQASGGDASVENIASQFERELGIIWSEVLGQPQVAATDHFFRMGGHSLKAAQVIARVRSKFGVSVQLRELYSHPTLREFASAIELRLQGEQLHSKEQDLPIPTEFSETLLPDDMQDQPLSFAEQRLWFVDRLEPNHPFYNLPLAAEVRGRLDIQLLEGSFQDVVDRHETLRSTYRLIDGDPVREIVDSLTVSIDVRDLSNDLEASSEASLEQMLQSEARKPFDLQQAPLVRVTVYKLAADKHLILLVMHHIISDGWSMAVMLGELAEAYRARRDGTANNLPKPRISYRQFAAQQRARLTCDAIEPSLEFWRQTLSGCTETIDLPTDYDRPPIQDFDGATLAFDVPEDLSAEVLRIARMHEATPFMVMLAAYGALLSRLSGQDDFNVGTAVANRTEADLEALIGFFVGTIVLRMRPSGDERFSDFLDQVRETTINAFEHAELPFEKLVEVMAGKRDRSHAPLFQTAIVMQNTPRDFAVASGLEMSPHLVDNGTAKYDLTLFLWEQDGRLTGYWEYKTRLFRPETIAMFGECLQVLLRSAVDNPRSTIADLELTTNTQRETILERCFGQRIQTKEPNLLHEIIEERAKRFADRVAVRDGELTWSYQQLVDRSISLAGGLQAAGVGIETPVMLYMQRSADQIAMQTAVMMAGGAFIPVDTSVPPARIQTILDEAGCKHLVVAAEADVAELPSRGDVAVFTPDSLANRNSGDWVRSKLSGSNLAYIIFTSGSTGKPKGVLIEHASICNFVRGFCERVELTEEDHFLNNLSPSFDGTLSQTFTALAIGASIEVVSNEILLDPVRLTEIINDRNVTFAACTPSMFSSLDSEKVLCMRKVLSAGEALTSEAAQPWMKSHQLYNGYGPTECTIGSAIHQIKPGFGRTPPIGIPLRNMSMYVLDRKGNLVPDGVIGDVYIGGAGVGRGYMGLPEQTAARFIDDPFIRQATGNPGRMYLTGDLGRWNKDGFIEILGRGDNQIKLRGFRIEPGEIAAAMEQLPEVRTAAVVAWGENSDGGAGVRLVGYFVPDADAASEAVLQVGSIKELEQTHIESWRKLFDQSHQQAGLVLAPEDDFSGWQSVITGKLIPLELMREWADQSALRIRKLSPTRMLEVGCGTGLIMLRLTDAFEQYQGIDVLPSSVEQLQRTIASHPELQQRVHAQVGLADKLEELPQGNFDTIVLNSVVQYFPSVEYLVKVLRGAVDRLEVGGKIFLGDLRDLRLHGPFATEVELARSAGESLTVAKLRRRILSRMEHDEELLVEPSMFQHLKTLLPRLKHCEVLYKVGDDANELNRYRFDIVLHFDEFNGCVGSPACDLRPAYYERDGRLRREWLLWNLIRQVDGAQTVDDVLRQADNLLQQSQSLKELISAAEQINIELESAEVSSEPEKIETWGNNPLQRRKSLELVTRMRDRLREKLPDYMIPSAFVALDRLPLTVQGKLDRAALPPPPAARPEWAGNWKSPRDEHETLLVEIWEDLLEIDPVGIEDDFFELGGHSMLAVRMMAELERRTGVAIPLAVLFQKATIEHLAKMLREPTTVATTSAIIPLAVGGSGPPLFCIHPAGGTVFCYRPLAELLQDQRPVYGLQAQGITGGEQPHQTLTEMAGYYADAIKQIYPGGPYHLLGWSLGGNIAFEVARTLQEEGKQIDSLVLLDSGLISESEPLKEADFLPLIAALFPGGEHSPLEELRQKSTQEQLTYFIDQASQAGIVPTDAGMLGAQIFRVFQANIKAVHNHRTAFFAGRLTLVRPADQIRTGALFDDQALGWRELVDDVEVVHVPGDHAGMLRSPAVDEIAKLLGR